MKDTKTMLSKSLEPSFVFFMTLLVTQVISAQMTALGYDEFYHMLAAQSWLQDGTLAINEGIYDRAWLFTKALGLTLTVFGPTVDAARILPTVGASLWAALLFIWARQVTNRPTAWLVFILLCLSGTFLHLAPSIRFYSWHGCFIFISFMAICAATNDHAPRAKRIGAAIFAIFALMIAYHLQATTVIACAGFAAWLLLTYGRTIYNVLVAASWQWRTAAVLTISSTILFAALQGHEVLNTLWRQYTTTALWNESAGLLYYNQYLQKSYAAFWALYPAMAVFSIARYPRYGLAAVIIFTIALVFHSFAGMKATRYVIWVMPFFFFTAAINLIELLRYLHKALPNAARALSIHFRFRGLQHSISWLALVMVVFVFLANTNRGTWKAFERVFSDGSWRQNIEWTANWTGELSKLQSLAQSSETIITTHSLAGLYFLGRTDYVLSRTILLETTTKKEFGRDPRTGLPVISSASSLRQVIQSSSSGLILVDPIVWGDPVRGTSPEVNSIISENTSAVDTVDPSIVLAFTWAHSK